jgi:serine/threonine-protein kinase
MSRTSRPAPGRRPPLAGRYVLLDQVGAGGMGSVWRAWDVREERYVAAKVLGQHDSSMLLRFVREQSVRIRHPHVVAPTGWAADDDLVVFTMDLVRGGSVEALLADHGPLPEEYVAVLLDQTLQALDAIHAAGVVHRDVKPANLLLEATGTGRPVLRVGDFGVAALVDDVRLTRAPGPVGTDGYLAPEQADGAAPDPRQDLYAAGVVALELLTGRGPRQEPRLAPGPGRLRPLLDALTDPDPDRRPPTAAAALDRLRRIGVPPGAPWRAHPRPPHVPDRLGDRPAPGTADGSVAPTVAIACVVVALVLSGLALALVVG